MVSALTLLELDELMARDASYEQLATIIRHRFQEAKGDSQGTLCANAVQYSLRKYRDHARNHAAFWNGKELSLTQPMTYVRKIGQVASSRKPC